MKEEKAIFQHSRRRNDEMEELFSARKYDDKEEKTHNEDEEHFG